MTAERRRLEQLVEVAEASVALWAGVVDALTDADPGAHTFGVTLPTAERRLANREQRLANARARLASHTYRPPSPAPGIITPKPRRDLDDQETTP